MFQKCSNLLTNVDGCVFSRSLAIPDGLVMDPLAPTALAVSSEFMDRIGSGLTILREHGKKVQKVGAYCIIIMMMI